MKKLKCSAWCKLFLLLFALNTPLVSTAANSDTKNPKAEKNQQEQREAIEKRRKKYESLSKAEKKKVREAREKYKEMTPEERRKLKERWKKSQGGT